jgi:hypothetical protein
MSNCSQAKHRYILAIFVSLRTRTTKLPPSVIQKEVKVSFGTNFQEPVQNKKRITSL